MQHYEYTVIPAPSRGEKARGAKTGAERFSYALLTAMNRMAANGWEYVRAETLPCEERSGLTSRTTVYHNVLVFRRSLVTAPAHQRAVTASHEPPAAHRPLGAAADAAPQAPAVVPAAAPVSEPPATWPDGDRSDTAALQAAAAVDDYDEPGFDPAPDGASPGAPRTDADAADDAGAAPAFVQRPPLAAQRKEAPASSGGATFAPPGGARLGPAER